MDMGHHSDVSEPAYALDEPADHVVTAAEVDELLRDFFAGGGLAECAAFSAAFAEARGQ